VPLSPRFLVCALFVSLGAPFCGARAAVWAQDARENFDAAPSVRVGAARAIRLVDAEGRALQGTFSDPKWETRGGGLFFTREANGTRNIWRAFPDPRDASRYPRWRALPVTQFVAPLFASDACPLEGEREILMLSNAANPRGGPQVTLFNLQNRSLRALTKEPGNVLSAAPAPDGSAFAFVVASREVPTLDATLRGQNAKITVSVWKQNLSGRAGAPELMKRNAWRPAWQGADWLLVENILDSDIFRLPVGNRARAGRATGTKIAEGSQISASRDGSTLIVAGKTGGAAPLYLLSGDGSGLLALGSTEGAQSPALSGNGRLLAFIAPLESKTERAIWVLPLQAELAPEIALAPPLSAPEAAPEIETAPTLDLAPQNDGESTVVAAKKRAPAPVAQIRSVQNAARGAIAILGTARGEGASATLEIGQGAMPNRWEARPLALPIAANAPLLVWNPPVAARGLWNFRLTVSGPGGAAQSLFSVQLPLAPRTPPRTASRPKPSVGSMPAGGPLPAAPLPDLPAAPQPFVSPLPPLSPAPPVRESPADGATRATQPLPRPNLTPSPSNQSGDAATFNVSNTLAQMKAGQSVGVTFWALNRGSRTWDVGPSREGTVREGTVRLVTRWVRFESGNRNGWTYQTMKNLVLPGARARWNFELVAPSQPGRYKLIYALQRVASGWQPPAYNAPQETWPDDFAAIAFAVVVKP